MRPSKSSVIVSYALVVFAIMFYIVALLNCDDAAQSTLYVAHGCFCLLVSIWMTACS